MRPKKLRSETVEIGISCNCSDCEIQVVNDPAYARRGQWVEWRCDCDGDRFVIEFGPGGPIVPRVIHANCGDPARGLVRPGNVLGKHKYTVYVICGEEICLLDPDLIIDD